MVFWFHPPYPEMFTTCTVQFVPAGRPVSVKVTEYVGPDCSPSCTPAAVWVADAAIKPETTRTSAARLTKRIARARRMGSWTCTCVIRLVDRVSEPTLAGSKNGASPGQEDHPCHRTGTTLGASPGAIDHPAEGYTRGLTVVAA